MFTKTSRWFRIAALLLAIAILISLPTRAVEPRASNYLSSYSAYVYNAGWYKVQVWFSVDGVDYMDEIGALNIWLYESIDNETWTQVAYYGYTDNPGMLGYNNFYHDGHVEYAGTIGRYYKAQLAVWAGKDGDGDTRYFWTSSQKATLFAG